MAVHFALRPRFRLDEEVVPSGRPRFEIPAVVGPVAAYWAGLAVFTCALLHVIHSQKAPEQEVFSSEPALAPMTEPALEEIAATDPEPSTSVVTPPSTDAVPEPLANADTEFDAPPTKQPEPEPAPAPAAIAMAPPVAAPQSTAGMRPARSVSAAAVTSNDELADERLEPWSVPHRPTFERQSKPERSSEPPIAVAIAPSPSRAGPALPSCEAAIASANQELSFGGRRVAPDLSREAFAGVLENGAYLSACRVPDQTALEICVAVQGGRAKGVTVVARPQNASLSQCVRRAVGALGFPYSSKLDVTRTRFEPLGRR
jgi:hypothetical protein